MELTKISQAIVTVMTEVNGIAKNMTVGSGNNSYKGVADKDVKEAIRESMIKNGLSILPIGGTPKIQIDRWEEVDMYSKSTPKDMKTKQSVFTEIETKYILLHTSGESMELYGYGQGVDTQDKGAGKATTYALKNTLLNMFLIPTGVDTDNTHSDDLPTPAKSTTQSQSANGKLTPKYFNKKDFEKCISEGFDTEKAIVQYIKDYGYTVGTPMKAVIRHYLDNGEIIDPVFN